MTHFFLSLSIRTKLVVLLVGTAFTTLIISGSLLWIYQLQHYRNMLVAQETATAQLISDDVAAALLFNDSGVAREALAQLREDPHVEQACLFDKAGNLFARFSSMQAAQGCPDATGAPFSFQARRLFVHRTVTTKGETVGVLILQISLEDMYHSLLRFAQTTILSALIALSIAALLSSTLQRVISRPILHLTRVATKVSEDGNYLLRARRFSNDETGVLIDQFNAMMERIEERDAELKRAQDGLEDKVRSRTQDLEREISERKIIERDLETARIYAENASRAKSAFLANMSHELRTPLSAVIGYSEILHEDAVADCNLQMASDLEKIVSSARHLLTLISDILDLSKIEAGKLQLTPTLAAANALLHDVQPTAEVLARQNQNALRVEGTIDEVMVEVDALRMRQCLLNLVSNSCKFTERGTITLRTAIDTQAGRDYVVWSVTDTGIGIAPEHLDRLFKTFSQVDDSNARRFGGSGLGLAISQQLCQAMGGFISVESALGQGSTFSIHIPVVTTISDSLTEAA
ncbi:Signal transduction histidine kinase [Bryocella elongata]|uniref:histidine kinase n=1 Tax=Bryocella elongata TaxID=863522 RepID=A0A1H5ZKV8_9BACT|nr:ATP-binding protein [Bryocella elongata]SEG36871.1 Signal transduction histidine kinase [Bryocella elongata]